MWPRFATSLVTSVLVLSVLPFGALAQNIVINEIHYNPPGDDPTVLLEFIELFNADATTVGIGNWELDFGPDPFVFPAGATITPGDYVVVADSATALFNATGHATSFEWGGTNGLLTSLGNGSDDVVLRDGIEGASNVIDSVTYDDDPPWPTEPDGNGPSLELLNPALDNSLPSSWLPSIDSNGTPGAINSVYSDAPVVVATVPVHRSAVQSVTSVTVVFSAPVTGVVPGDLMVGGSLATDVSPQSGPADTYVFTGFAAPTPGSVTFALNAGGIQGGSLPFAGHSWTASVGVTAVLNEIHYHPPDPYADAEFLEIYNAGTNSVDMSNWTISDGLDMLFPPGTVLGPDAYLVVALNPTLFQNVTGYTGALQWQGGRLSNSGERLALSDTDGNELDVVDYGDGGEWDGAADGDGPSLELINPQTPNGYGPAWAASVADHGTPGSVNSVYDATPAPIIISTIHSPAIPAAFAPVTITALVLDNTPNPMVTLYHRQDQDPTVAYSAAQMNDEGTNGDLVAGDSIYSAVVAGLPEGARLDFTIRADDGVDVSAAPQGHDNLNSNGYPTQTYLCKFTDAPLFFDYPQYHLITTQRTRNLQSIRNKNEYDATFIRCQPDGSCEIYYNIAERYRGASSLTQNPPSFRFEFPGNRSLESEMGFDIAKLNLMGQQPARQALGYGLFEDAGHASPHNQFVRLNTNPLADGGTQDFLYINVERIDDEFLTSQDGQIAPLRFPDRCSISDSECDVDADCPTGETCEPTSGGNVYRGRHNDAEFRWEGFDPAAYMVNANERNGYQVITNEDNHDWTDLINLCDAMNCSTSDGGLLCTEDNYDNWYPQNLGQYLDIDQWMEWFAVHMVLNNVEGGIYRDTGDDYFIYFRPTMDHAVMLPWDMDAIIPAGQDTIWRTSPTNLPAVARVLRHNAFAGRFVKAICDLLGNEFSQAAMDARIDALPDIAFPTGTPQGNGAQTKAGMKAWIAARHTFINNEIVAQTTLDGVPGSPYPDPDPVIQLSGLLNQCGTQTVWVNGQPVDDFSVFDATWSQDFTLVPGLNNIVVEALAHDGSVVDSVSDAVTYIPPGAGGEPASVKVTAPTGMVNTKTITLRADILDALDEIHWQTWTTVGIVSARRVTDQSPVPTSVTVFETRNAGTGAGGPGPDEIRFYNGVGNVSITIDDPASVAGEDIEIEVNVLSLTGSTVVTALDENDAGLFTAVSGTLSGAVTWGPSDGVIHLTGNVTVGTGSTLTIEPGTLIMVDAGPANDGTAIFLNGDGSIQANGTESEPIMFFPTAGGAALVLPQTQDNNPNAWQGIFHNGSGVSNYSYVFLVGAGNGNASGHPRAGVLRFPPSQSHTAEFNNCVVADCAGKALFIRGPANVTVRQNSWSRIGYGGEFLGGGHTLLIEDSWFTRIGYGPESLDLDGDIFHLDNPSSSQTIRRSVLADCGDDMMDHSGANPVVEDTLIWDADDKCVSLSGGGSVTFNNVLVFGMPLGVNGAGGILTHVTINVTGTPMGAPISVDQSIVWPQGMNTGACNGNVNYTLAGSTAHLMCGTGNLSTDPLFQDSGNCDYSLLAGSPASAAGPTGGRIGWLGFPEGSVCVIDGDCDDGNQCTLDTCDAGACVATPITGCMPCTTNADCDDGEPCTNDTCSGGVCTNSPGNEGGSCDDGLNCTSNDVCSNGTCAGTEDCLPGLACDLFGECSPVLTSLVFQDDDILYTGTQDTFIRAAAVDVVHGTQPQWEWDGEDPDPSPNHGLIRFDGIVGPAAGQIPEGATVISATLTLVVFDPSADAAGTIHLALVDWDQGTTTFNNLGPTPGAAAGEDYDVTVEGSAPTANGVHDIDVTSSVQAWVDDSSGNHGWVFVPGAGTTDGVQVRSSEFGTLAERPILSVEFQLGNCDDNADCDDGLFCNGGETCNLGTESCEPGTPPDCDDLVVCTVDFCNETTDSCDNIVDHGACEDGNVCTNDACDPVAGCQYTNNSAVCEDGDACTENDVCAGGACQSGSTVDCDDGVSCTTDSCDSILGCQNVDNCPLGEVCNLVTDICEEPGGLQPGDVIISGFSPHPEPEWIELFNTTDQPIALDTMTLVTRLDIGTGDGTVEVEWTLGASPVGMTIPAHSFFLVGESGASPPPDLVDVLDLATGEGGSAERAISIELVIDGVHQDYVLYGRHDGSVPPGEVPPGDIAFDGMSWPRTEVVRTVTGAPIGSFSEGPTQRLSADDLYAGYAVEGFYADEASLPDSFPAGVWTSAHSTASSGTPRNSSTSAVPPPVSDCNSNGDCDDGDLCNGVETCQGGSCTPGALLDCDDGNLCTDDSCDSLLGCQYADNTAPCDDGDACTTNDACAGGACASGPTLDCDDGNICTDDSCDALLGCQYADNSSACDDGVDCTEFDVCSIGVCAGVDTCPGSTTCNPVSQLCELGSTFVFQQDQGGYLGTEDTFIQESAPTANNGAAETLEWDNDDPSGSNLSNFLLIRFGSIFASEGGPIPDGATVASATLTYNIEGPQSPTGDDGSVHEVLTPWDESTTFASFGGEAGVQSDEYNAVVVASAPGSMVAPPGPIEVDLDVTTSLQGWSAAPGSNFGWIVLPLGSNGVQVASSEYAPDPALRPKLTVVLSSGPTSDPPVVAAVGSRYLAVTPAAGPTSVALLLDSPSVACLPKYIDSNGLLTDAPVFLSSLEWGTVFVADAQTMPETDYHVQADTRDPSDPVNLSVPVTATTWLWGDTDDSGDINVLDIVCVLDGYQDIFNSCSPQAVDLAGVTPNRIIDVFDIISVLDAYQDFAYPDANPCAALRSGAPPNELTVRLIPDRTTISPGESVWVDVFADAAIDLRAYELGVGVKDFRVGRLVPIDGVVGQPVMLSSNGIGDGADAAMLKMIQTAQMEQEQDEALVVVGLEIETDHPAYVFSGVSSYPVVDANRHRLASAALDGVTFTSASYLGTFELAAGNSAEGHYVVKLADDQTHFVDTAGNRLLVNKQSVAFVRVR